MSKKPNFSTVKEKRLLEAQQELENEVIKASKSRRPKTIQTTLVIEADLYYAIQEICLKRKRADIKPYTLTGIIKEALKEIAEKEDK